MGRKKYFTYSVTCVFEMQFTFDESQVEGGGDPDPTDQAILDLEEELREHIGRSYPVSTVEVDDNYLFLGVSEDD